MVDVSTADREASVTFVSTCNVNERDNSCGRPTETFLCSSHVDTLVDALRQIAGQHGQPSLVDELDVTITRTSKTGGASISVVVRGAEKPLPFHEAASEMQWVLRNTVSTWARDFAEANTHLTLTATTVEEAAAWMAQFPTLLAMHPAAVELHDELVSLVRQINRVIDRPADRVYVGPCGGSFAGVPCDQPLFGREGWHEVRCHVCGTEWSVEDRREWMLSTLEDKRATSGQLVTLVTANGVPITASTIRSWVARGKLASVGSDEGGRPTYRVGDVLDVIHRRAQKAS